MPTSTMPRKSLTIRIAERVLADSPDPPLRHQAALVLALEEVKQALSAGNSVKAIWRELHGEGKIN